MGPIDKRVNSFKDRIKLGVVLIIILYIISQIFGSSPYTAEEDAVIQQRAMEKVYKEHGIPNY